MPCKDGHFVKIASELSAEQATREIDAAGALVSPPFIDAHVHLDAVLTVGAAALQYDWYAAGRHPDLERAQSRA